MLYMKLAPAQLGAASFEFTPPGGFKIEADTPDEFRAVWREVAPVVLGVGAIAAAGYAVLKALASPRPAPRTRAQRRR
jgi:hypothetical protein